MVSKLIFATAFIAATSAHQIFRQLWVNDVTPGSKVGIRMPPNNSPVVDITSNDMACNVGGSKVPSGVQTIPAKEGDTIKVQWDASAHPGPLTHMLFGPVDDASKATGVGAGWFKIDELDNVDGKWSNEIMRANNMTHEFKLPTGLASGEYLLRSEKVAIHNAQAVGGAEFYMGCAQLKITGTGSGSCSPTISIPGTYKASDPNILIPNMYDGYSASKYTAPGGPIASCGGSGTPSKPSASPVPSNYTTGTPTYGIPDKVEPKPAVPTTFTTLIRSTTAYAPIAAPTGGRTATGSAGTASVAKIYAQCGGIGFTGPTVCENGGKCVSLSEYWSQCTA